MLGHAAAGRWDDLANVLAEDFVVVEPDSCRMAAPTAASTAMWS